MLNRILYITSLYHPHVGGIETFVSQLADLMNVRNVQTVLLTKKWPATLSDEDLHHGVKIFRVSNFKTRSEMEEVIHNIDEIESDIKADLIHIVGMRRSLPILGLYLSFKWNVPLVISYGGGEIASINSKDDIAKQTWKESKSIAEAVTRNCDWNVTFSEDLVRIIKEQIPNVSEIDVIHAGIDYKLISEAQPLTHLNERRVLFSLRRLVWSKGVDLSIKCFARIAKDFPDVDLVIAGEGEERRVLEEMVTSLKLQDRIFFVGTLSLSEAYSWLKSSYVTLVPSRSEGGGIVNIEAQACGCPVIGSRATGIPEYTSENITSLLFDIEDLDGFEQHLRTLLSDKILRERMSNQASNFAKSFDWTIIADKFYDKYSKLVDNFETRDLNISPSFEYYDIFKDNLNNN